MIINISSNESGQRLDKFLKKYLKNIPLNGIYKHIRKKDIRVNGEKSQENYILQDGDVVELNKYVRIDGLKGLKEEKVKRFTSVDSSSLKITYEDKNILVVEKWPGVLVHQDSKNGEATLTDYVLSYLNEKGDYKPENEITFTPAPCNRLDRNTSGIVVFGKSYEGLKGINKIIRENNVRKYYIALVKGKIAEGLHEAYIKKNEENNISKVYKEPGKDRKKIAMDVKVLETVGAYSLLDINLITGRSHQLRAHLAELGNPIIGDPKYGDRKLNSYFDNKYALKFQYLYAYKLIFNNLDDTLSYLENKTIVETLPPIFKKIKKDVLRFN